MKITVIYELACMTYAKVLRDLLIKAIEDPEQEWDDAILKMLDGLFGYTA